MNKKPKFDVIKNIGTIAITLAIAVLVIALTAQMLGESQATMTENSTEYNATGDGITGIGKFSGKMGTIATVSVLIIIIGLLGLLTKQVKL